MSPGIRSLLLALVAILPVTVGQAQEWRTIATSRSARAADSLRVRVEFAAGSLSLGPDDSANLYDVRLRYDATNSSPLQAYDSASHTLSIMVDTASSPWGLGFGLNGLSLNWETAPDEKKDARELALLIGRSAPLDLSVETRAVEGKMELGGLSLSRLHIKSRGSDVAMQFSHPNRDVLTDFDLDAAAADIKIEGIGRAHATRIQARARIASVDLDFSGDWTGNSELRLDVAFGQVTLRVPSNVGVKIQVDKFAADFSHSRLVERDGAFYSENWATASRKLVVDADVTFAGLTLDWIAR
ncbi:MAG: hypothetical protein ABR543_14545 [Gemmatimonadaceae bacterium]